MLGGQVGAPLAAGPTLSRVRGTAVPVGMSRGEASPIGRSIACLPRRHGIPIPTTYATQNKSGGHVILCSAY